MPKEKNKKTRSKKEKDLSQEENPTHVRIQLKLNAEDPIDRLIINKLTREGRKNVNRWVRADLYSYYTLIDHKELFGGHPAPARRTADHVLSLDSNLISDDKDIGTDTDRKDGDEEMASSFDNLIGGMGLEDNLGEEIT